MGYIEGENRYQRTMFPATLNEYITKDNPVRVIDKLVDAFDLEFMGFKKMKPAETGRPPYKPGDLLKLYLYGYYNGIRSSRKLERECKRNIEIMWLIKKLTPSHQTKSEFRQKNKKGIKNAYKEFTIICKKLGLYNGNYKAIDGSRFKADTNINNIYTKNTVNKELRKIEKNIEKYLKELDKNDKKEEKEEKEKVDKEKVKEIVEKLKKKQKKLKKMKKEMDDEDKRQISTVDKDCKVLKKNSTSIPGYNIQISVDNDSKLVILNEVTNDVNDKKLLYKIANKTKKTLKKEEIEVLADKGYFSKKNIKKCYDENIKTYVPREKLKKKNFSRKEFEYDPAKDIYKCPAGKKLKEYRKQKERGLTNKKYKCYECDGCEFRKKCTTSKTGRTILRWEHEDIIEDIEEKLEKKPDLMVVRKSTVEHVFGIIKHSFGYRYFLTRGFENVQTESSLMFLSYNLKKTIKMVGVEEIIEKIEKFYYLFLKLANFGKIFQFPYKNSIIS